MREYILEAKKDSLEIECRSGHITFSGNSILPNPKKFFQPVSDWIDEYIKEPAAKTEVILKFNYVDTASVTSILELLKKLRALPNFTKSVHINWYFEFDDPELLEIGEIMEARLATKFNYIEHML